MSETIKIYVWPDGSWINEDDAEDLDWYISSNGKSDDYSEHDVDINLEADDIEELIELQALPGMLHTVMPEETKNIEGIIDETGSTIGNPSSIPGFDILGSF